MKSVKTIIRTPENSLLTGVCGSFAEYLNLNARIVRIVYALLSVVTFFIPGFIFYMFLMLIIPRKEA